ncbi:MAG: sulfotransferase [Chloroflexota bacterium]|nr:sulfotransferase [Chloroflexota bacterium]
MTKELPHERDISVRKPPIFVVGIQRSGTSLLRRILDTHPNIACPPESKFILPLEALIQHDQALRGLASMGFTRQMVMERLRDFAEGFFEAYAAAKGKNRWADKTPNYVNCLPFLDELFAHSAVYIVIVRHPFDVCLSFEDTARKNAKPMRAIRPYVGNARDFRAGACQFWNDQNLRIASFLPQVSDRALAVSYELLTSRPVPVVREITEFLAEPWDPAMLDFNRVHHDHGFEDRKIDQMPVIVGNSGKFSRWSEQERLRLAHVAREAMEAFGYTLDQPTRHETRSALEAVFVRTSDDQ